MGSLFNTGLHVTCSYTIYVVHEMQRHSSPLVIRSVKPNDLFSSKHGFHICLLQAWGDIWSWWLLWLCAYSSDRISTHFCFHSGSFLLPLIKRNIFPFREVCLTGLILSLFCVVLQSLFCSNFIKMCLEYNYFKKSFFCFVWSIKSLWCSPIGKIIINTYVCERSMFSALHYTLPFLYRISDRHCGISWIFSVCSAILFGIWFAQKALIICQCKHIYQVQQIWETPTGKKDCHWKKRIGIKKNMKV